MSLIRTAIIDDEIKGRLMIRQLCDLYLTDIKIVGEASNADEALILFEMEKPDLVFLDIEMPGKTGIELLRSISEISFQVIFVTAFNLYAVEAFRLGAVDYLLKPVVLEELQEAVARATEKIGKNNSKPPVQQMVQHYGTAFTKITIPTLNGLEFVDFKDIIYLEGERNYTTLFLKEKKKITASRSLGEFEELLEPHHFFRIHKSNIINLSRIVKYTRGEGGAVTMDDGTKLDISRRRKDDFLAKLKG